ncbi:MAG: hypothetical protein E7813_10460 [Bradyrhizobium sp.]|uniref:hypothetical protein n=1 Tax=Bradyrhizobium sp. TaxID=376 RepID=UPI001205C982|nr:hypothetical protein [Bradyrhizobium sp.]THD68442.1 MAG: hypothetical protein E7813_10460 [Bradyrhizobium sp.]
MNFEEDHRRACVESIVVGLTKTSDFRSRKAKQYPDDPRNARAAETLKKATTSKRSEGGVDIHSIIISAVDQHAAGGGLDKVMKTRYATPMRAKSR